MTRSECIAFARELGQMVADADSLRAKAHAAGCPACARRLLSAVQLAGALRVRPELPLPLRSPRFLEAIHESIVRDFESPILAGGSAPDASGLATDADAVANAGGREDYQRAVRAAMQPVPAPDFSMAECLDPFASRGPGSNDGVGRDLGQELALGGSSVPSWMWIAVRDSIRRDVSAQRRVLGRRRRFALLLTVTTAAMVLVLARISMHKGTLAMSDIVFLDTQNMPLVEVSPVAVLRNGGVR